GECGRRRDGRRRTDAGGRTGRPLSITVVDSSGFPRCCPLLALGWLRQPVAVDVLVDGLRRDPQVVSDVEDREALVDQLGDLLTRGGFVVSSHVRLQGTPNLGSCQPPPFVWGNNLLVVDKLTGRRLYLRPTRTTRGESGSATRKEAAWNMKVGSLFAGIGGFDLAAERVGMQVAWQSELDPHASRVLAHHWPGVPNLGDIH